MPAHGRWDLTRRVKVVLHCGRSLFVDNLCVVMLFVSQLTPLVQSCYFAGLVYILLISVNCRSKTKLRGLSPHANYTDRAAAAGRRS